eukprot:5134762-Prorocentrum_lima.AAC.1
MARSRTTCPSGIAKCLLRVSVSCLACDGVPESANNRAPRPTMASSSRTPLPLSRAMASGQRGTSPYPGGGPNHLPTQSR